MAVNHHKLLWCRNSMTSFVLSDKNNYENIPISSHIRLDTYNKAVFDILVTTSTLDQGKPNKTLFTMVESMI